MDFSILNNNELLNAILCILLKEETDGNKNVTLEDFQKCLSIDINRIETSITLGIKKSYCSLKDNVISLTEKGSDIYKSLNNQNLSTLCNRILKQSYSIYKVNNHRMDAQYSGNIIAYAIGTTNMDQIIDSIRYLEKKGYLKVLFINPIHRLVNFQWKHEGIIEMENPNQQEEPSKNGSVNINIENNSGAVAIGSNNVSQQIGNLSQVDSLIEELKGHISKIENDNMKETAELALETLEDSLESDKPNVRIIDRVLNVLTKVPGAISTVSKIQEMIQNSGVM